MIAHTHTFKHNFVNDQIITLLTLQSFNVIFLITVFLNTPWRRANKKRGVTFFFTQTYYIQKWYLLY